MCLVKQWLIETCQDVILIFILQGDFLGAFHLDKISGISGSAVNGTRFVHRFVHWKIPRKSGKFKKMGLFSRLGFPNGTSFSVCTFLVVCTEAGPRSGTSTKRGLRPNGTNFYQSEIPLLLPPKFGAFFFVNGKCALFYVVCARKYKN